MDKTVKKVFCLIVIFFIFDRFMVYKIGQTRRYARLEILRKKKQLKKMFHGERLAQGQQSNKSVTT